MLQVFFIFIPRDKASAFANHDRFVHNTCIFPCYAKLLCSCRYLFIVYAQREFCLLHVLHITVHGLPCFFATHAPDSNLTDINIIKYLIVLFRIRICCVCCKSHGQNRSSCKRASRNFFHMPVHLKFHNTSTLSSKYQPFPALCKSPAPTYPFIG